MLFASMCISFAVEQERAKAKRSKEKGLPAMRKTVCTASGDKSKLLQQALQSHTPSGLRDKNTGVEERTNLYPMRKDLHSTAEGTEILHKGVSAREYAQHCGSSVGGDPNHSSCSGLSGASAESGGGLSCRGSSDGWMLLCDHSGHLREADRGQGRGVPGGGRDRRGGIGGRIATADERPRNDRADGMSALV